MDDLERFWSNIFSEDPALIGEAWSTLETAGRAAVLAHLQSIIADPQRPPDQRRASSVALSQVTPARIVLASASPRRRKLIVLLGLPFETVSGEIDEAPRPGEDPASMVARLSRAKARAAASALRLSDYSTTRPILVSADTTVSLDGEILAKPADVAEARSMLTRLRGRSHHAFTAITLIDLVTGRRITDLATTDVPMRDYDDAEIDAYITSGDPFDKAGGYAIQHDGFNPVTNLRGCYANVVGLPLCHATRSLRALGVDPPVDVPAACQANLRYECPVFEAILKRDE
jgi:MAF protein